jgi:hypothetical protein
MDVGLFWRAPEYQSLLHPPTHRTQSPPYREAI